MFETNFFLQRDGFVSKRENGVVRLEDTSPLCWTCNRPEQFPVLYKGNFFTSLLIAIVFHISFTESDAAVQGQSNCSLTVNDDPGSEDEGRIWIGCE